MNIEVESKMKNINEVYKNEQWIDIYICDRCKFNSQMYMKCCMKCNCEKIYKRKIKVITYYKNGDNVDG